MRSRAILVGIMAMAMFVGVACGDDDGGEVRSTGSASGSGSGSASGSGSGSGSASEVAECVPVGDLSTADTTVDATLDEFSIELSTDSVAAGAIGFVAENVGEEPHELVIVEGVPVAELPRDDHGGLDEAALPEGALIGEIEAFPAGETCDGTFELTAGDYALVCNITEVEEGEPENHLHEGMVTTFTVT